MSNEKSEWAGLSFKGSLKKGPGRRVFHIYLERIRTGDGAILVKTL